MKPRMLGGLFLVAFFCSCATGCGKSGSPASIQRGSTDARAPARDAAADAADGSAAPLVDQGFAALAGWDALPVLDGRRARMFSSYDRDENSSFPAVDPGNKDFNNFVANCGGSPAVVVERTDGSSGCDGGIVGHLLAAVDDGPGFVSRIYLAAGTADSTGNPLNADTTFSDEQLRIYVDDLATPALDARIADLEVGTTTPFVPPLATAQSGTFVSYVPISFQSKLRVVLDGLRTVRTLYYYQVDVASSGPTLPFSVDAATAATPPVVLSLRARKMGRQDAEIWADTSVTVAPGEAWTILDRDGAGTIESLNVTADGATAASLAETTLRATWDDATATAIDVPLSALFASDGAPSSFSLPTMQVVASVAAVDLTCTLPMPFSAHAKLELVNTGAAARTLRARIDGIGTTPRTPFGTLHAVRNRSTAPMSDPRYVVANVAGPGKFVGESAAFSGQAATRVIFPSPFNFLEGDDRVTVDSMLEGHGTGVEESFDGGWYFKDGPYSSIESALVSVAHDDAAKTGRASALRVRLPTDTIAFENTFLLDVEYGANHPATALDYSSVALFYSE